MNHAAPVGEGAAVGDLRRRSARTRLKALLRDDSGTRSSTTGKPTGVFLIPGDGCRTVG